MIRFNLWLLSILCVSGAFKVMNLNMYNQFKLDDTDKVVDGIRKFANVIKSINADIVTLQEAGPFDAGINGNYDTVNSLSRYLGSEWSIVKHCQKDMAIVTKHQILGLYEHTAFGVNVRVRMNGTAQEVSVWSMHLDDHKYGPFYAAEESFKINDILAREEETSEYKGRVHNIVELIKHPEFVKQIANSHNVPVIVSGCFNTPSHLDWTEATKSSHQGHVVPWLVTNFLTGNGGMTDSYREVHPDPKRDPGNTWSLYDWSGNRNAEKNRIDYIFYSGSIRPKSSTTYNTKVTLGSNWKTSEWPSDHAALITEFEETQRSSKKSTSAFPKSYLEKLGPFPPITKCSPKIIH